MALTTKRQLAEIILIELANGIPSDDFPITLRQIGIEINLAYGVVAKKNFYENANFDGYTYINDSFLSTYSAVAVSLDDPTGLKYSIMPSSVVGLPKNRGVVRVSPPRGYRLTYKKIAAKDVSIYSGSPEIPNVILYWEENGRIWYLSCGALQPSATVNITMAGQNDNNLDTELKMPIEALEEVQRIVVAKLRPTVNTPIDKLNDGIAIRDAV